MMIQARSFHKTLLILFILIVPVHSHARGHHKSGNVEIDIISDQRGPLQQFNARPQKMNTKQSYIIGRNDERYRIRISNPSNQRVGVVIAVDGRNIISGKKSHLRSHERMYTLAPYQSQEFVGWRVGRQRTNRFHFNGINNPSTAQWGDQTAMGVVAIAVFNERYQQSHRKGKRRLAKGEWYPGGKVHFAAQNRPAHKTFIKYEGRQTLCRMGVIMCKSKRAHREHNHTHSWPHEKPHTSRNDAFALFQFWFSPSRY